MTPDRRTASLATCELLRHSSAKRPRCLANAAHDRVGARPPCRRCRSVVPSPQKTTPACWRARSFGPARQGQQGPGGHTARHDGSQVGAMMDPGSIASQGPGSRRLRAAQRNSSCFLRKGGHFPSMKIALAFLLAALLGAGWYLYNPDKPRGTLGPVAVLCRSSDHILCSKGDEP